MTKILSITAALVMSIGLSSCSFSSIGQLLENNDKTETETENENIVATEKIVSNDITIGLTDFDEFNPIKTNSSTVKNICSFIFESLYTVDASSRPVAELAESSSLSADGLIYTVTLKSNVLWHDGKSFSASDVVNSINDIKASGSNYIRYTNLISSAQAVDDRTVKISFIRPVAEPDALMVFPIVRQRAAVNGDTSFAVPIGTGPFKMVTESLSEQYRLEAFDGYYGGRASIDAVNIITLDSVDKLRTMFYANEIDLATTDMIDMSSYTPRSNAKINDVITNKMIYVGFNTSDKALSDPLTRRAVSSMINRDEIVSHYLFSRAKSAEYAINPSSWLYFDTRTHLKSDNSEAEILLEEAGWVHDSNDSLYNTFGGKMMLYFTPEILVNSENDERIKIAEDLCDKLNSFGIRAFVKQVNYETYQSRIISGDYDIFIGETELLWNGDISELVISSGNYFRFANADVDLLLTQIGTVTSEEDKKAVTIKLFEKIYEESPFVPICFRKESLITGSKIKQLTAPGISELINDTELWGVN